MNATKLIDELKTAAVAIYSPESLEEKLLSGRKLRIKMGADPSRPDLHIGHSVVLRKLKLFQSAGHEVIFVIGDFTAMIGDPSGKSKTRVPLTFEETRANGQTYFQQVSKILDPEKTLITYNSEWLAKMNFTDVLALAGKYTLAQLLERDDFANRFKDKQAIGLHELFYPLMQGYDSVALQADIEVGGTDQTFNLLVGRELQRDYGQAAQEVITFPLLPGLDGQEKMSKSLNNYIGLEDSPELMFEKCMKVPDTQLEQYFRLTTDIKDYPADMRAAHFLYAREILCLYHNEEAAQRAEKYYREKAAGTVPEAIESIHLQHAMISILDLLVEIQFAGSKSEARRLITGNGIKLNGSVTEDIFLELSAGEYVISRGKGKILKIILG